MTPIRHVTPISKDNWGKIIYCVGEEIMVDFACNMGECDISILDGFMDGVLMNVKVLEVFHSGVLD